MINSTVIVDMLFPSNYGSVRYTRSSKIANALECTCVPLNLLATDEANLLLDFGRAWTMRKFYLRISPDVSHGIKIRPRSTLPRARQANQRKNSPGGTDRRKSSIVPISVCLFMICKTDFEGLVPKQLSESTMPSF